MKYFTSIIDVYELFYDFYNINEDDFSILKENIIVDDILKKIQDYDNIIIEYRDLYDIKKGMPGIYLNSEVIHYFKDAKVDDIKIVYDTFMSKYKIICYNKKEMISYRSK